MASTQLRLTVWKPLSLPRAVARSERAADKFGWPLLQEDELFVEAYSWRPVEDPWSSARGEDVEAVRSALLGRFSPFEPPENRGIGLLRDTIASFERLLEGGATTWRDSLQPIPPISEAEDEVCFRVDSMRAFYLQLRWIYQVFHTVPNANVTVR